MVCETLFRHSLQALMWTLPIVLAAGDACAQTFVVAASDSTDQSKASADYVCDGDSDQHEINQAIRDLPEVGGTVTLMEGTYDICKVAGKLGGVLIERSNVTLAGQGSATRLIQAANQNTNVIRIIGLGVSHVTVRDLLVDANRDANPDSSGDRDVSHARFEFCGIKAWRSAPGGAGGPDVHHITVRDCIVRNSARLGIMLDGPHMRVLNNELGNAFSDSVEILTGPGMIRGNFVEITGRTHVAIGTDRAENMVIADNVVHIKETGDADIGIRQWAGHRSHVISNNVIRVEPGGRLGTAMDIRGNGAVVANNYIAAPQSKELLPLWITGGGVIFTGNLLENVELVINDKTEQNSPILVRDNLYANSRVRREKGNLVTAETVPTLEGAAASSSTSDR